MSEDNTLTGDRADLLAELGGARYFLRHTARDLTDEQAARRTTVSELTIGGLIKHVAATEAHWAEFIVHGPSPAHRRPNKARGGDGGARGRFHGAGPGARRRFRRDDGGGLRPPGR